MSRRRARRAIVQLRERDARVPLVHLSIRDHPRLDLLGEQCALAPACVRVGSHGLDVIDPEVPGPWPWLRKISLKR